MMSEKPPLFRKARAGQKKSEWGTLWFSGPSSLILFEILQLQIFILSDKKRKRKWQRASRVVFTIAYENNGSDGFGHFPLASYRLSKRAVPSSRTLLTIKCCCFFRRNFFSYHLGRARTNQNYNKKKAFTGTARQFDGIHQKWEMNKILKWKAKKKKHIGLT